MQRTLLVAAFLPLLSVSGLQCSLPEMTGAAEDYVSICAMCSDSEVAVRWTVREGGTFDIMLMVYKCVDENGTQVYSSNADNCFQKYPDWRLSLTGTTGVGHVLRPGLRCNFTMGYRTLRKSIIKHADCVVKRPETCVENPDECAVDRVSRTNEMGQCEFQCTMGYSGQLCNNIDECAGNNTCDDNAVCHDTDGSYWCHCNPGFDGNGYNCTNIDECAGNDTCDDNADCHDTDGSYWCQCRPGFHGDGYNCTDIIECQNVTCPANSTCFNTEGSFSCQCDPGFTEDGYNCTNIDECLNVTCGEDAECVNSEGNYSCQCLPGFTGDGHNCTGPCNTRASPLCREDIDECVEEPHKCTDGSYCKNTAGSYDCIAAHGPAGVVAVVVPVVCGILLLLVLLVTVLLIATHHHSKKQKMPELYELAETEFDPHYMPTFWSGSLLSIRSMYEKLIFTTESTTDVSRLEEGGEHGSCSTKDIQPTAISEKVDNRLHTNSESERCGSHKDYVPHSSVDAAQQKHDALNSTGGIDSGAISPLGSETSPDRDKTFPNATMSCDNYTFEVPLPDIMLPPPGMQGSPTTTMANAGYVQECRSNARCNQHQVTERDSCNLELDAEGSVCFLLVDGAETDYAGSTSCSSGYQTESVDEVHLGRNFPTYQETRGSDTADEAGREEQFVTEYVPSSVGSSSGYSTDSTAAEELASSTSAGHHQPSLTGCHSQTSLQSGDSYGTATELAEHHLDSVKFTLNARQEFEYVNAVEERFLTDVKFGIQQD